MIIGVVGKIASGKSTVCNYIQNHVEDSEIIDVDSAAKTIYCEEPSVVEEIMSCFGETVCSKKGKLNYNRLASMIFSSKKALDRINEIMFPKIENKIGKILDEKKNRNCLIIDAAILFDSKLYKYCDHIIWVKAERERCCKRLSSICDLDDEQINTRIDGQVINIKEELVDFVIENNSTMQDLVDNVKKIVELIKSGLIGQ